MVKRKKKKARGSEIMDQFTRGVITGMIMALAFVTLGYLLSWINLNRDVQRGDEFVLSEKVYSCQIVYDPKRGEVN